MLNKIHQNVQRFLTRCQEGWDKINWDDINFTKIQDKIVTEDYHVEKPAWVVEKETRNNISNNSNNSAGDNSNNTFNHRNKRFKSDSKEPTQEINHEKDSRFNIPDGKLKYGEVFTAKTRKAFGKTIRNDETSIICHRFNIKGICDTNCRMKNSHKKISKDKIGQLLEFAEFTFNRHPKLKCLNSKSQNASTESNHEG